MLAHALQESSAFHASSTLSSDGKDSSSNVNLLFGVERSLMRSWYLPWHSDTKIVGEAEVIFRLEDGRLTAKETKGGTKP